MIAFSESCQSWDIPAIAAQTNERVHCLTPFLQTLSLDPPWLLSRKIGPQTGDGTEGFRRDQ
jgi:hypothetical protein